MEIAVIGILDSRGLFWADTLAKFQFIPGTASKAAGAGFWTYATLKMLGFDPLYSHLASHLVAFSTFSAGKEIKSAWNFLKSGFGFFSSTPQKPTPTPASAYQNFPIVPTDGTPSVSDFAMAVDQQLHTMGDILDNMITGLDEVLRDKNGKGQKTGSNVEFKTYLRMPTQPSQYTTVYLADTNHMFLDAFPPMDFDVILNSRSKRITRKDKEFLELFPTYVNITKEEYEFAKYLLVDKANDFLDLQHLRDRVTRSQKYVDFDLNI